jgi:hypothetical protein
VAADGGVGAAQVAWFPGFVQRAEGGRNVLGELGACGGVDGIGAREAFEIPELSERPDVNDNKAPLPPTNRSSWGQGD